MPSWSFARDTHAFLLAFPAPIAALARFEEDKVTWLPRVAALAAAGPVRLERADAHTITVRPHFRHEIDAPTAPIDDVHVDVTHQSCSQEEVFATFLTFFFTLPW